MSEIARDRAIIHAGSWCAASSRPLEVPNICCERQHAVPRDISCDSERISDRQNFRKFLKIYGRNKIVRDRAEIHAAWWCAASSRPLEVPNICCERQHAVPREISCDSERISDQNFRKFSILRSKIARDRAGIHAAWWCTACSRPLEVPDICCERQHAVPREISCDSERISN